MSKNRQAAGFSLVQLVVAVTVVGLLAFFALPKMKQYFNEVHEASFDKVAAQMVASLDEFKDHYLKEGHGASVFEGFTMQPATGYPIAYNTDDCIKIADKIAKVGDIKDFYHQAGESKTAFDLQYSELRAGNTTALKGDYAAVFDAGICHFYCLKHDGLDKFLTYNSTHAAPLTIVPFNHMAGQKAADPVEPAQSQEVAPIALPSAGEVVAPAVTPVDDHVAPQEQPAAH